MARPMWRKPRRPAVVCSVAAALVVMVTLLPGPANELGCQPTDPVVHSELVGDVQPSYRQEPFRREVGAGSDLTAASEPRQQAPLRSLQVAPESIQERARSVWYKQARHFESRASELRLLDGPTLGQALEELDAQYMGRLFMLAAQVAERGEALLVVGKDGFAALVRNKKYVCLGVGEFEGQPAEVMAIVEDEDLPRIEAEFVGVRSLIIAEQLILHNAKPLEERRRIIELMETLADYSERARLLGVSPGYLHFVMVNKMDGTAMPSER